MSDYATRDELNTALKKQTNEIVGLINTFMQHVDERFSNVEQELSDVKLEIVDLKLSHDKLINTIDGFIGRIDKYETELTARDSQFNKLLVWARKVSEKTGIPLDNL